MGRGKVYSKSIKYPIQCHLSIPKRRSKQKNKENQKIESP
jgi:hypothetical protein